MSDYAAIEHPAAEWIQPRTFDRHFELRAEGERLGALVFRSSTGTLARAETGAGCWTFKRVGFLNPRVSLRVAEEEDDLGEFQPKLWGGGLLTLRDGATFGWSSSNFWMTSWTFRDAGGHALVEFSPGVANQRLRDALKNQASVSIEPAAIGESHLPLLVTFGMYLLVLRQDDAAAVVVATG